LVLSISAVLLLAAAVAVLCRWAGLRTWHAVVCVLLGFYLAASPLAPAIADLARTVARLISGH
jgi:hypothetical protein